MGVIHFRVKDCLKNLRMTSHKGKAICWLITNVDVAASCINWLLAGCCTQGIHLSIRWGRHYMLGGGGEGAILEYGVGGTLEGWNMGILGSLNMGRGHTGILE